MFRGAHFRGGAVPLLLLAYFVFSTTAYPLCVKNLEAPGPSRSNLTFCSAPEYAANGCCTAQDDTQIKATFNAMEITDPTCATFIKQILCSKCDPYSAGLYGAFTAHKSKVSPIPLHQRHQLLLHHLWNACSNVTITNSPFEPNLQESTNSTPKATAALNSFDANDTAFCRGSAPQASSGSFCFNGTPLKLPELVANTPPARICLERLDNAQKGYYLNLIPHPDGSNCVFVNTQDGLMCIANVSEPGSGGPFRIDYGAPFLNITHRTLNKGELGFMGIAFHPNYLSNGRFFISYNCDMTKTPDCKAQCGCSSVNGCNTSAVYCQYSAIVAEYTVNATGVAPQTPVQQDCLETTTFHKITPFMELITQEERFGHMDCETHGVAASTGSIHLTSTVLMLARTPLKKWT